MMRSAFVILCATFAGGCFATEGLQLGVFASDAGQDSDVAVLPDDDAGRPSEPELDAAAAPPAQDADVPPHDASRPPEPRHEEEEEDEHDAGPRAADAGADASGTSDAGTRFSGDAGPDAARSLLCTFEPWHCT